MFSRYDHYHRSRVLAIHLLWLVSPSCLLTSVRLHSLSPAFSVLLPATFLTLNLRSRSFLFSFLFFSLLAASRFYYMIRGYGSGVLSEDLETQRRVARSPRRCVRHWESCLGHQLPCCDPCATCYCRFFNAICYCRRIGNTCSQGRN
uniref:Agouti-related protein n=1 Tax=Erpetoichthys calabaricus TaxID=27687 RepID=A0A8C4SWP4_ERPCA